MGVFSGDMGASTPFYVTRKHGRDGETGQLSMSIWMQLLVVLLVWLNVVIWGCIGLYEAARVVLG